MCSAVGRRHSHRQQRYKDPKNLRLKHICTFCIRESSTSQIKNEFTHYIWGDKNQTVRQLAAQDDQYLTATFSTSLELTHILSSMTGLCEDFCSVKTEAGRLIGDATIRRGLENGFLSIKSNKPLFVCSQTFSGQSTTFSALSDDPNPPTHKLHNYSNDLSLIATKALTGFSNKPGFCFFHLPANIRLLTYHCSSKTINRKLTDDETNFRSIANISNTILPSTTALDQFRKIAKEALNLSNKSIQAEPESLEHHQENIQQAISECFKTPEIFDTVPLRMIQRHELCKDLVARGYANADKVQSLQDVIRQLHTSRAFLAQGCKEALGIGPMEVLRFIRLEHIHLALRDSSIRKKLNLTSVEDIREHYGFISRGNFASTYKTFFGESPNHTLTQSRQLDSEQQPLSQSTADSITSPKLTRTR